jgi:hypothetical protein
VNGKSLSVTAVTEGASLHSEHRDVIFLAEGLRGCRDLLGGLGGNCGGAVEAEEFIRDGVGCFQDAVSDEG